ncbi:hypothetical protein GCM10018952_28810 [Streptosporangium vulgare]
MALKEILLPPGAARGRAAAAGGERGAHGGAAEPPGIVTVHNLTEEAERLWIVMEFLEALTLHDTLVQAGPLPVDLGGGDGVPPAGGVAARARRRGDPP